MGRRRRVGVPDADFFLCGVDGGRLPRRPPAEHVDQQRHQQCAGEGLDSGYCLPEAQRLDVTVAQRRD